MEIRIDLKYTKEHEWLLIEGSKATLGITDFAQSQLGDIVYVELPEVGTLFEADEAIGNIESVKAVSEIFCPVSGEILEINKDLEDTPETANSSPYDEGWMIKVKIHPGDLNDAELMDEEEYAEFVKAQG
ncbi:MAG: glycine cleavage system protein GcvH [SAR324 cluster bacterium]|nr:glycine cleavage system protein GcvH [SAR324 cluster bacterium]